MTRFAPYSAVFAFFWVSTALVAAEAPGDLATQARAIFKKHCVECHDGKAGNRSSLTILDYPQLVDKKRKLPAFVKPKAPLASQIVEFIEDGSMPPGDRPKLTREETATVKAWIDSGAVAYPRKFDDSFANASILADLEAAPQPERQNRRYFSLHHLLDDAAPATDLVKHRDAFRIALNSVAKKELAALQPIDATETIFRVDLRELGWDTTPFRVLDRPGKNLPSRVNIFDFLMLEYPYGEMPAASSAAEQLADIWLRPIDPLRPVISVRADWFTKAVEDTPLKSDIKRLLSVGAIAFGDNVPDKKDLMLRPEDLPAIAIRPISKTIPIVPIDAWYASDYEPKPPAPKIEIAMTDAKGKPASKFQPGERVKMAIRSNETVFMELIQIDAEGSIFAHDLGAGSRVQANVPKEVEFDGKNDGLLLGDEIGKQRFIVFAAVEKFPTGDLLQSKPDGLPIERYVHHFYELPKRIGDPLPRFDPAKMVRKTAIIEVTK